MAAASCAPPTSGEHRLLGLVARGGDRRSVGPGDWAESSLAGCAWRPRGPLCPQMAEPWDWASVRWGSASVAAEVGVVPLWGEGWGSLRISGDSSFASWAQNPQVGSRVSAPPSCCPGMSGAQLPPLKVGRMPQTEVMPRVDHRALSLAGPSAASSTGTLLQTPREASGGDFPPAGGWAPADLRPRDATVVQTGAIREHGPSPALSLGRATALSSPDPYLPLGQSSHSRLRLPLGPM